MKKNLFLSFIVLFLFPMLTLARDISVIEGEIDVKTREYQKLISNSTIFKKNFTQFKNELDLVVQNENMGKQNVNVALETLQEKLTLSAKYPELSLEKEREKYKRTKKELERSSNNLKKCRKKLLSSKVNIQTNKIAITGKEKELNVLTRELAEAKFKRLKEQIEQEKIVVGEAEVSCGEKSIKECIKNAREDAKRDAAEKGTRILLDSITETKNYIVIRDEIKTKVRAEISGYKKLEEKFIGMSVVYCKIEAKVKGRITSDLKEQVFNEVVLFQKGRIDNKIEEKPKQFKLKNQEFKVEVKKEQNISKKQNILFQGKKLSGHTFKKNNATKPNDIKIIKNTKQEHDLVNKSVKDENIDLISSVGKKNIIIKARKDTNFGGNIIEKQPTFPKKQTRKIKTFKKKNLYFRRKLVDFGIIEKDNVYYSKDVIVYSNVSRKTKLFINGLTFKKVLNTKYIDETNFFYIPRIRLEQFKNTLKIDLIIPLHAQRYGFKAGKYNGELVFSNNYNNNKISINFTFQYLPNIKKKL